MKDGTGSFFFQTSSRIDACGFDFCVWDFLLTDVILCHFAVPCPRGCSNASRLEAVFALLRLWLRGGVE